MARFEMEEDGFVIVNPSPPTTTTSSQSRCRHENDVSSDPIHMNDLNEIGDHVAKAFWIVNCKIHNNPELAYKEFIAHDVLTAFMRTVRGWKVKQSIYGIKTAWEAVFDTGKEGPVVSFNAEMDALPNIGHACGHNLIATASVVGAITTAGMMSRHNIPGKVVLFGTPAEEGGGGKIKLLKAGAYSDHKVDISLISHPGIIRSTALLSTAAYSGFKVEFFGQAAHAAANPEKGINALDALVAGYVNFSLLRQQTMPGDIIQGHITHGGGKPNIIHEYAAGKFVVRALRQDRLRELRGKVVKCFEAGAVATGAEMKITMGGAYMNHVSNRPLAKSFVRYFNPLVRSTKQMSDGESTWAEDVPEEIAENPEVDAVNGTVAASTDQGDISHAMPSISPGFRIIPGPQGQGPHNPEFAEAAGTEDAYARAVRVAKALAGTAIDVLTQEGLLEEVKRSWREDMKREEGR